MSALSESDAEFFIATIDPCNAEINSRKIGSITPRLVDGRGYYAPGRLFNDCLRLSRKKVTVIASDRVTINDVHLSSLFGKLSEGYGYVGLYRFAFFAIHMDLIARIGWFEERFVKRVGEDRDFVARMKLANIAAYEDHSAEYRAGGTRWASAEYNKNIVEKWDESGKMLQQTEDPGYRRPVDSGRLFLTWENSVLCFNFPDLF